MAPKISIVIPVYNSARYLRECLDSIRNQSLADWEVVAVDDGSTDDSGKILDDYATSDIRYRVIHKANGGVSAARNDGLAAARGDYVLFVDSDDWLDAGAFKVAYDEAIRCDADVVVTDHWTWKENGGESLHHFFAQEFTARGLDEIAALQRTVLYRGYSPYPSPSCSYMFSALWTKLIRRSLLTENNIRFDGRLKLYEDGLVALRVFQCAKIVAYRSVPTYHYRILKNSLCHINEDRLVADSENILDAVEQFVRSVSAEDSLGDAFFARALFLTKKMALRSFFCKGAAGSFLERYSAFRNVLAQPRYREAVRRARSLKLCGNERGYGWLLSLRLQFMVALMYEVRRVLR